MLFVNKENPHVFYFKEKMFTKEKKDGREAPKKPSILKKLNAVNLANIVTILLFPLISKSVLLFSRQIAVSALITTTTACIIIMVKESLDVRDSTSCYYTELGKYNSP